MSNYQNKPGEGTLWQNDGDKKAAFSGKLLLPNGEGAFIDLYPAARRDGTPVLDRNGNVFYNVRVKVMDVQGGGAGEQGKGRSDFASHVPDMDDSDIPF
jgi:hypothetical protein